MIEAQPRYVAYAQAHGKSPAEMLAHDAAQYIGGKMTGYICWISEQWAAWDKSRGHGSGWIRTIEDHEEFTKWLNEHMERMP